MNVLDHGLKRGCLREGVEGRNGYNTINEGRHVESRTEPAVLQPEEPASLDPRILKHS